ncbi:MAG: heme ABC transporter permease CcmC [Steroidobacteraceae bacterium]
MNWVWFHRFGSPPYFYRFAGRWAPWFLGVSAVLLAVGLYGGLVLAPADYFQSDVFRIMYVHVPSAYLAEMTYSWMAAAAAVALIWRIKIGHAVAAACAPAGAGFTLVSLATGMIWGQPTWGTYWAWDPRIVSQLFVLFFFLGYIALRGAIEDRDRADRASAVLAIVGVVNLPIVHYSVVWWNSLHQGPTLTKKGAIPMSMAWPLLVMLGAYTFYFIAVMLMRARAEVLRRERGGAWLREELARAES